MKGYSKLILDEFDVYWMCMNGGYTLDYRTGKGREIKTITKNMNPILLKNAAKFVGLNSAALSPLRFGDIKKFKKLENLKN